MYMSHIALNRIVEERAARDKSYRRVLERDHRPLLSHGRSMSDDELLAKLRQFGFDAQRQGIADGFPKFVSAEAMSKAMIAGAETGIPDTEVDWVWIATTCLWERWQPDLPNMEMVDDKMQAGYASLETGDTLQACRLWLETWRAILDSRYIRERYSFAEPLRGSLLFGARQMSFGIDRYIGHWRDAEGYRLEIKKINEEQASASLLSPIGFPVNRSYFEGKPTVHMPAIYDDYEGTMEVQLWRDESGFVLELLHEPAYDFDESRREALVPALSTILA